MSDADTIDAPPETEGEMLARLAGEAPTLPLAQRITDAIACLSTLSSSDNVLNARMAVDAIKEFARDADRLLDSRMSDWIKANGELSMGSVRWYVGAKKVTKCVAVARCLEALFEAGGGSFEIVATVLASQPIKHGAANELLTPSVFADCFKVEFVDELKEGKAKVQRIDSTFIKPAKRLAGPLVPPDPAFTNADIPF